ncbi:MAG: RHS repeat-associated core domain-containing protein [Gemmatimonadetes bacterium]|nr:RHS repeat-associated core domain-containing protein [Gemmatimonadota bacterium]
MHRPANVAFSCWTLAAALVLVGASAAPLRAQIEAPLAGGGGGGGAIVVTPDNGSASAPSGSSGQTLAFTVANTAPGSRAVTFSCATTGPLTCTGLSIPSYSFDDLEEITVTATYSTGAVGSGTLTLSATGTASDDGWYTVLSTGPAPPVIALTPHNATYRDVAKCVASCFDAVYAHATPAYFSLGAPRALTLAYNSQTHKPTPVIPIDLTLSAGATLPTAYSIQVRRSGVGSWFTLLNGATIAYFAAHASGQTRIAAAFDAATNSLDSTGAFPLELSIMAYYPGNVTLGDTVSTQVLIAAQSRSAFGAGFDLAGYQRLYKRGSATGDVVITEGDGSIAFYDSVAAGYARPAGAPGVRLAYQSGKYTRTYLDGSSVEFNANGFMTRASDRFGNATLFAYLAAPYDSLLSTITDPTSRVLRLCYNASCSATAGKLHHVEVQYGSSALRTVTYTTVGGKITQIQDPDGYGESLAYGANSLLASVTDRGGNVSELYYDGLNRLDSLRAPSVTLFDGSTGRPRVTFQPAERTVWQPTTPGNALNAPKAGVKADTSLKSSVTDPLGAIVRYSQDAYGTPTVVVDPFGVRSLITRDGDGRVTRVDEANGAYAVFTYNGHGQLTYAGDGPGGRNTYYHYLDTLTSDLTWIEGDRVRTDFHYYGTGQAGGPKGALKDIYVGVTGAWPDTTTGQLVERHIADPLGRDTAVVDPLNHKTRYTYHASWGNLVKVRDPSGIETRVTLDSVGRPDSSITPLAATSRTAYGVMNQVLTTTWAAPGYRVTNTYDPATLALIRVETPRPGGAAAPVVYKFGYNALGALVARYDATDTTKADTLKYDLGGNLRKFRTRRGDVIDLSYDKVGRLLSRAGPGFPTDYFLYDTLAGRWNVAYNSVARDSFHLDTRGRLDAWRQTMNGRTYSGSLSYDTYDRVTRRVLRPSTPAADSSLLQFAYTTGNGLRDSLCVFANPKRCLTFKTTADWVADTLVFNRGTANAWRLLQGFDANHRITSQTFTGGTNLAALELPIMTYDSVGRNKTRTSPKGGAFTRRLFRYDRLGRLTNACDSTGSQCQNVINGTTDSAWTYDSTGNRGQLGTTTTYGAGNRLAAFGTTNLSYDAIGSIVCRLVGACPGGTGSGYKYSWDALGRLRGIRNGSTGALVDSMFYDALGRRVRKQMAAADEYYVYEGDQVIFDLNAAGTVLREYAWYPGGVDRLLALRATTPVVDTLAAILDPINGTVRGLARFRTGAKVKEFTEAPWGDAVADTGIVVRYRFAGREYDSETGLYYMRARYYDPALGRWISEDPIGIAGGLNVYAYAGNDPVNGRDPSGLDPDCDPGVVCLPPLERHDEPEWIPTWYGTNGEPCNSGWTSSTDEWVRLRSGGQIPDRWRNLPGGGEESEGPGEPTQGQRCAAAFSNLVINGTLDFTQARWLERAKVLGSWARSQTEFAGAMAHADWRLFGKSTFAGARAGRAAAAERALRAGIWRARGAATAALSADQSTSDFLWAVGGAAASWVPWGGTAVSSLQTGMECIIKPLLN